MTWMWERAPFSARASRAIAAGGAMLLWSAAAGAQQAQQAQQTPPPVAPDSAAPADSAGGRSHTVRKGETLWELSRIYLNDPFLWPEIYRLNSDAVDDPHWIFPGQMLHVPGAGDVPQIAAQPDLTGAEPTQESVEQSAPRRPVGATIFARAMDQPAFAVHRSSVVIDEPRTAVRPDEYYAAPWVDRRGGPEAQGRLISSVEIAGIGQASVRMRIQPEERVYVTLPQGLAVSKGDYLMLAELGPEVGNDAQVVEPTGIVEVERVGTNEATTARIIKQYGAIQVGNAVLALDRFSMPQNVRPSLVPSGGAESKVVWIPSQAILPTIQRYVLLDAPSGADVKMGDQLTLYRPRTTTPDDVTLPEERIALVQVVRANSRGITGIIVDQAQPSIKEGTRARITARMP